MVDIIEADAPAEPKRRRSRRALATIAVAVVVVLAGATTAVSISLHYLDARTLEGPGSFGWGPPDNLSTRFVTAGPYQSLVAPVRRGHDQSFYVSIFNNSSVTQTVLGFANNDHATAEPDHMAVSTRDNEGTNLTEDQLPYRSGPVTVPPKTERYLRYTIRVNDCWTRGRSDTWTSLDLKVKVGWFTRTETISFGDTAFVLTARENNC